jgi:hypothetical protein
MPLQGVVIHGQALACNDPASGDVSLLHAPLAGGPTSKSPQCARDWRPSCLWHVGHGYLWVSNNLNVTSIDEFGHRDDTWGRYRLDDLLRGKLISRAGAREGILFYDFMPGTGPMQFAGVLERVTEQIKKYKFHLHYDFLPVSEDEALLFQLCNVYGADKGGPEATAESANLALTPLPYPGDEEYQQSCWSLGVFRFRAEWNAEDGWWGNGKWKRVGSIAVGFREAFRILAKGDDYYFVTASGRLYCAPKPDQGGDRKMDAVWKGEKRPVVAFITDADADRSFLFCKPDQDGKGVYFEMSDKPDPQPYDAGKIPAAKPEDPLPAVLAYAKILVADKKIKDKGE